MSITNLDKPEGKTVEQDTIMNYAIVPESTIYNYLFPTVEKKKE